MPGIFQRNLSHLLGGERRKRREEEEEEEESGKRKRGGGWLTGGRMGFFPRPLDGGVKQRGGCIRRRGAVRM